MHAEQGGTKQRLAVISRGYFVMSLTCDHILLCMKVTHSEAMWVPGFYPCRILLHLLPHVWFKM